MRLNAGRVDQNKIVPDYGDGQNKGVDTVEHSAVAGQERARVFDSCAAFVGRFEQIADLPGDVAYGGCAEQNHDGYGEPAHKSEGYNNRAGETGDGAFPGFLGAQMRGEGMFAKRAACEVRGGIAGPDQHQHEKQEARAFAAECMQADCVRKRESYEKQAAGADASRRQGLDDGTFGCQSDEGDPEYKKKDGVFGARKKTMEKPDQPGGVNNAPEFSPAYSGGQPLQVQNDEGTRCGPEPIRAMTHGVTQREIF